MRYLHSLLFVLLTSAVLSGQSVHVNLSDSTRLSVASSIKAEDLQVYLSKLASDEFEGRETGTPGQHKAAAYIADFFRQNGIQLPKGQDNYFQEIAFLSERWTKIEMAINNKKMRHLWDYYAYPATNQSMDSIQINEVTFLGYGIESKGYNDYAGMDSTLRGKTILIFDGEPITKDSVSYITGTDSLSEWSTDWRQKLRTAKKYEVGQVLIIDRDFQSNLAQARKEILNTRLQMKRGEDPENNYANNVFVNAGLVKRLLPDSNMIKSVVGARDQINQSGKPVSMNFETDALLILNKRSREIISENVVGFVEGTDSLLKKDMVIVSGHYDHLGKRGENIYYGANDNGSGTSSVMEIAQAIAQAKAEGKGPRRSILFLLFAGEEKGLLGSKYYVTHPIYDLGDAVANVNIDMVGRTDRIYKDSAGIEHIYVIGADRLSSELHEINEDMNHRYAEIKLDYTYNEEDDPNRYYYRSDHYNFAEQNIPIIFYFNGTHEDYHRITDTVDKIEFDRLERVVKLAFHTVWQLANQDRRIVVDKIEEAK